MAEAASRSSVSMGAGPGSTIPLAPETIRVRDAVIGKCEDMSLEEMNNFVKELLNRETDEMKRLGILAARVFILRTRIANLMEATGGAGGVNIGDVRSAMAAVADDEEDDDADEMPDDESSMEASSWYRLRILDDSEVNGVRFPKGVIIDVRGEDAEKLIAAEKAELQNSQEEEDSETEAEASEAETPAAADDDADDIPAEDMTAEDMAAEDMAAEDMITEDEAAMQGEAEDSMSAEQEAAAESDAVAEAEDDAATAADSDSDGDEATGDEKANNA